MCRRKPIQPERNFATPNGKNPKDGQQQGHFFLENSNHNNRKSLYVT